MNGSNANDGKQPYRFRRKDPGTVQQKLAIFSREPRRTVYGDGGVSILHQRHHPNVDAAIADLLSLYWPAHVRGDVRHHPIARDSKLPADHVLWLGNRQMPHRPSI